MSEDKSVWVLIDTRNTCIDCDISFLLNRICAAFSNKDKAIEKLRKYKRSDREYCQWLELYKFPFNPKKSVTKLFKEARNRESDSLECVDIEDIDPRLDGKFIWILTSNDSSKPKIYGAFESDKKLADHLQKKYDCIYHEELFIKEINELRPDCPESINSIQGTDKLKCAFYITKTLSNEPYETEEDEDDDDDKQTIEF